MNGMDKTLKRGWITVAILAVIAFGVSCAKSGDSGQETVTQTVYEVSEDSSEAEDGESSYVWHSGDVYI